MRKLIAALAAFALCAALLAGCTNNSDSSGSAMGSPDSTPVPGATVGPDGTGSAGTGSSSTAAPDGAGAGSVAASGTASASGTAYTADGLGTVLDGIVGYGADTAGGSLKAATAAGDLVAFAAQAGSDSATLGADAKAWLDKLSDKQKEALRTNWAGVKEMTHSIATDLEGQAGVLADAGVTHDFAKMDMSGVDAFVNTLDSVLGAY